MQKINSKLAVFRSDASSKIGNGHIMRCITLAKELFLNGYEIVFICRAYKGNLIINIRRFFKVLVLENSYSEYQSEISLKGENIYKNWLGCSQIDDAKNCIKLIKDNSLGFINLLFVDHYSLDKEWEKYMKASFIEKNKVTQITKIFAIDDLASRKHYCDFLLDQTLGRIAKEYKSLVNLDCKLLIGSEFAILRKEFQVLRKISLERKLKLQNKNVERIFIYLGTFYDLRIFNLIFKSLSKLSIAKEIEIDFSSSIREKDIKKIYNTYKNDFKKINIFNFIDNIYDKIFQSDLCIGAAGSSSWERCTLGCPSINIITDENQRTIGQNLSIKNASYVIDVKEQFERNFCEALEELIFDNQKRYNLSKTSSEVCDGNGTQRIIKFLEH